MTEFESYIQYYEKKREQQKDYFLVLLFLITIIFFILNFIIPTFFYSKVVVIGASMESTIEGAVDVNGKAVNIKDYVGVVHTKNVKRGDVVVFYPLGKNSTMFIKRVVAVEGDTVSFEYVNGYYKLIVKDSEGNVIINGNENYIKSEYTKGNGGKTEKIKPGQFYALGDNRQNSSDSRDFGAFDISSIFGVGRRIYREKWLFPGNNFKLITSYSSKKLINPLN